MSGFGFPNDLINFKPDFHIYLRISKQKLIENRNKFLEENADNPLNEIKDSRTELLILNNLSYKHYMENKEKSTYTFNMDVTEKTPETTYDEIFNYIIKEIEKSVYKK